MLWKPAILSDAIARIAQHACRQGERGDRLWPDLDTLPLLPSWRYVGEIYAPQVAALLATTLDDERERSLAQVTTERDAMASSVGVIQAERDKALADYGRLLTEAVRLDAAAEDRIRGEEREACAKVAADAGAHWHRLADEHAALMDHRSAGHHIGRGNVCKQVAAAIRARGKDAGRSADLKPGATAGPRPVAMSTAVEAAHAVARACVDWAADTGYCHFCSEYERTASHEGDCPVNL